MRGWLLGLATTALCACPALVAAQLPVPPPPPMPTIDGAPFLRFTPSLSLTRGDAQGWFSFEAGLRPPQESFGITTRVRATHVIGSFQPAAQLALLGGFERDAQRFSFHTLGGFGTATDQGWNVLVFEAGARAGRFRIDLRSLRSVGDGDAFGIDTLAVQASGRNPGPFAYADAELQWEIPARPFELRLAAGARAGSSKTRNETWSYMSAALPLPFWSRRIAAVGTIGRRPSAPELGLAGGRFAGLGFRLTLNGSAAARRDVQPPVAADDAGSLELNRVPETQQYQLKLRVTANTSVQVRGDFTDWTPLSLVRAKDGTWSTMLDLRPGVYQIEMRLDGADWAVPPGVVLVPDGFGGQVGVIEVR